MLMLGAKPSNFASILSLTNAQLIDKVDLAVASLSGGERQCLALSLAMLSEPKLLLIDEHTSALDPANASKIMQLTQDLLRRKGLTCLMVTHNIEDAINYGDRIIVLNRGQVKLDLSGKDKLCLSKEKLYLQYCA